VDNAPIATALLADVQLAEAADLCRAYILAHFSLPSEQHLVQHVDQLAFGVAANWR